MSQETKEATKPSVLIDVNGAGMGRVLVDGTEVKGVRRVSASVDAGEAPVVTLSLAIRERSQIKFDGALISINDVVMPVEIEIALWRYLRDKYHQEMNVTTIGSKAVEWALPIDLNPGDLNTSLNDGKGVV